MCEISYKFCQVISTEKVDLFWFLMNWILFVDYHRHSDIKKLFCSGLEIICEIPYMIPSSYVIRNSAMKQISLCMAWHVCVKFHTNTC